MEIKTVEFHATGAHFVNCSQSRQAERTPFCCSSLNQAERPPFFSGGPRGAMRAIRSQPGISCEPAWSELAASLEPAAAGDTENEFVTSQNRIHTLYNSMLSVVSFEEKYK